MPRSHELPSRVFSTRDAVQEAFKAMEAELPPGIVDGPLVHADHEEGVIIWQGPDRATNVFRLPREDVQDSLTPLVTLVTNAQEGQPTK